MLRPLRNKITRAAVNLFQRLRRSLKKQEPRLRTVVEAPLTAYRQENATSASAIRSLGDGQPLGARCSAVRNASRACVAESRNCRGHFRRARRYRQMDACEMPTGLRSASITRCGATVLSVRHRPTIFGPRVTNRRGRIGGADFLASSAGRPRFKPAGTPGLGLIATRARTAAEKQSRQLAS